MTATLSVLMTTPTTGPTPTDFDDWNDKKKQIHFNRKRPPTFKQGEVWWCDLGVNIGNEQNGDTVPRNGQPASFRRPVLVVKKLDKENAVVLPLTTQPHTGHYFYEIDVKGRKNWVLLVQIRNISAHRLTKLIVELPEPEFNAIRQVCRTALSL